MSVSLWEGAERAGACELTHHEPGASDNGQFPSRSSTSRGGEGWLILGLWGEPLPPQLLAMLAAPASLGLRHVPPTAPWPSSPCVCVQRSLFFPGHPALDVGPPESRGSHCETLAHPERACFLMRSRSEVTLGGHEFGETLFNPVWPGHIEPFSAWRGRCFRSGGEGGQPDRQASARRARGPMHTGGLGGSVVRGRAGVQGRKRGMVTQVWG